MKCCAKNCYFDVPELLTGEDNGAFRVIFCPNHHLMYHAGVLESDKYEKLPSEFHEQHAHCEVCGTTPVIEYLECKDNFRLLLCTYHLDRLMKRNLEPTAFLKLYKKYGDRHVWHDDFYDPNTGEAFQPVDE